MKILVCLKLVPDTTEVKLSGDFTLQRDFVAQIMNPADESALEAGFQLRDTHGGTVTVLSMGPQRAQNMLRDAFSRGADEAVLLTDSAFAGADTIVTAKCLHAAVRKLNGFDVILCGRRTVDGETGQVGPMLASLMDIACVTNAIQIENDDESMDVKQLTEDATITWKLPIPAVITFCEWSYRLRLPTLMNLKRSFKAGIKVWNPSDIGLDKSNCGLKASPTRVIHISTQPLGVRPCKKMNIFETLDILAKDGALG